jgi:hypothetical protein
MHRGASMTSADLRSSEGRRYRRLVLAMVAALDVIALAGHAYREGVAATHREGGSPSMLVASALTSAPGLVVVAALGLVALYFFARRRAAVTPGLVALAALATLDTAQAVLSSAHSRIFFASGAALAGWLVGLAFARQLRGASGPSADDSDEALAGAGAIAALAATYVNAGLSKVVRAGFLWADATSVQVAILVNHPVDDPTPLASYARFVVENRAAAHALSAATLAIELGAFVLVLGPRARMLWASLIVAFHLNVALLAQNIFYVQTCVLLLTFCFPWEKLRRGAPAPRPPANTWAPAQTRAAARRVGRWVVVAAAGAWLARALGVFGPP